MGRASRCSKKRKVYKEEEKVDRVSELPDEILARILSRLSVRDIATACSVSRRWIKLWEETIAVTPFLEFHGNPELMQRWHWSGEGINGKCEYVEWINQVMELHTARTLEKLTIKFPLSEYHSDHIYNWIEFAARKGVVKLFLDLHDRYKEIISEELLYCKKGPIFGDSPPMQCVRYVHLRYVNVGDKDMQGLLSNSPLLEHLILIRAERLRKLEISAPNNLRYIEINGCENLRSLNISAPNLVYLVISHNFRFRHVKICAPNLASLSYYQLNPPFIVAPVPHLSHACLKLGGGLDSFQNLLGQISNVKSLQFYMSFGVFENIANALDINQPFPELNNLEHLDLSIDLRWFDANYIIRGYVYPGYLWPCALIKAAPSLGSLTFKLLNGKKSVDRDDILDYLSPNTRKELRMAADGRGKHGNLKVVKFVGCSFTGIRLEVGLLVNLVNLAAVSLEKIIIDMSLPSETLCYPPIIFNQRNTNAKMCHTLARKLRTLIPSKIDVVVLF